MVHGHGIVFNPRHLVRSILGLRVPPGRFVHPAFGPTKGAGKLAPAERDDGGRDMQSREAYGTRFYDQDRYIAEWQIGIQGEESVISAGTFHDLWHSLVTTWSWQLLIASEVVLEVIFIVGCGVLLYAAGKVEGTDPSFGGKVLLALTTVRLSTDSIYGWQAGEPSTPVEVLILATFGWVHWFFLSLAAALIVARALRTEKGAFFAPDMVVTPEKTVQIRFMVSRVAEGSKGSLYNLDFRVQAWDTYWGMHDIVLKRSSYATCISNDTLTLRHSFDLQPDSPFNPDREGGPLTVSQVMIVLTALDTDGNSVVEAISYYNPACMVRAVEEKVRPFPRILFDTTFVDTYTTVKDPVTHEGVTVPPTVVCDLDNFVRTKPAGAETVKEGLTA